VDRRVRCRFGGGAAGDARVRARAAAGAGPRVSTKFRDTNLHVSLVVEIVLPSDVFYYDIHTFLLRCQTQMVPENKSKFHSSF